MVIITSTSLLVPLNSRFGVCTWSPDDRLIAVVIVNKTSTDLILWDVSTSMVQTSWECSKHGCGVSPEDIRVLAFSRDGTLLAMVDSGNTVTVWNVDTNEKIYSNELDISVNDLVFGAAHWLAITSDEWYSVGVLDLNTIDLPIRWINLLPPPLNPDEDDVQYSVEIHDFSMDGTKFVATATSRNFSPGQKDNGRTGAIFVVDIVSGAVLCDSQFWDAAQAWRSMCWMPDGQTIRVSWIKDATLYSCVWAYASPHNKTTVFQIAVPPSSRVMSLTSDGTRYHLVRRDGESERVEECQTSDGATLRHTCKFAPSTPSTTTFYALSSDASAVLRFDFYSNSAPSVCLLLA